MMDVLLLRFDAPLMSFGGVLVDQRGESREYPARSMLTGLIGNALGYEHREFDKLQRLQKRLAFAVRQDRGGAMITDYQTVSLGQPFMLEGWTTRGVVEGREGGAAKTGTHIREREYLADAVYTVALALEPAQESPTLSDVEVALRAPERPLFIGRKTCLPASRIVIGRCESTSLLDALAECERIQDRADADDTFRAWWSTDDPAISDHQALYVTDERDWANQVHSGRRRLASGRLEYAEKSE